MIILRIVLAVVFFAVGLTGLILPVMPGWIFLLVALVLTFPNHRLTCRALARLEPRAPRFTRLMRRMGIGVDAGC